MNRLFPVFYAPYSGLTASQVTSNTIDLRDAAEWTFSWRTTAGSVSTHTLQYSNHSGRAGDGDPPEASWVDDVNFGTGTPALLSGTAGARYARYLRNPSDGSVTIEVNKLVG